MTSFSSPEKHSCKWATEKVAQDLKIMKEARKTHGFVIHHHTESYRGQDDFWGGQMSNISERDEE